MATGTIQKNMVLLWENPNPSGSFDGVSPLTIDLSAYKWVIIEYKETTASEMYCCDWLCRVGSKGFAHTYAYNNGALIDYVRYANVAQDSVSWWNGGKKEANGTYTGSSNNEWMIPLRIYGIKA